MLNNLISQRSGVIDRLLFALLLLFGLDFRRADEGGSVVQSLLYAVIFGAFIWGLIRLRVLRDIALRPVFIACAGYVVFVLAVGVYRGIELRLLFGMWLPYLSWLIGMIIGSAWIIASSDQEWVVRRILVLGSVSILFRLVYAILGMGIDIDELRWQAGSSFSLVILILCVWELAFRRRVSFLAMGAMALWLFSAFVQVTRSQLVVALLVLAVGFFVFVNRNGFQSLATLLPRWGVVAGGLFGFMVILAVATPEILNRWRYRLFDDASVSGKTLTLQTREYEQQGVLEGFSGNVGFWSVGSGLGSAHYDSVMALEQSNVYNSTKLARGNTNPVHSMFYNTLKTSGVVGCVWLGGFWVFISWRVLVILMDRQLGLFSFPVVAACATLCAISSFGYADVFFNRDGAFMIGLFVGMVAVRPISVGSALGGRKPV